MNSGKLQTIFEKMSQAYAVQDFDAVVQHYELPGALYMGRDIVVWQDKPSLRRFLKQHCACNYALGCRSVDARVIAQSIAHNTHFSAWVLWSHLSESGVCLFKTQVRYFLRRTDEGTILIQLAEVAERPLAYNTDTVPRPFRPEVTPQKQLYVM